MAVRDALNNTANGTEVGGLAAKDPVISVLMPVAEEINTRSREYNRRREHNSGAKQIAEDDFNAVIVPRLLLWNRQFWRGHQISPQNPL